MKNPPWTNNIYSNEINKISSLREGMKNNKNNNEIKRAFVKAGVFTEDNKLTKEFSILSRKHKW